MGSSLSTQHLPWLDTLWNDLQQQIKDDRLPHAMLFTGPRGYGKAVLARQLARGLLCKTPREDGEACGNCSACDLLQAGTHPDLMTLAPEEEGKVIPVDSVRAVGAFLALKPQFGERQVVIINPADAMNRYAANSLLKTLEEPTPGALIILICNQVSALLPTIVSRCSRIAFPRPAEQLARDWLRERTEGDADVKTLLSIVHGSPLQALKMYETGALEQRQALVQESLALLGGAGDPLRCAASWGEIGLSEAVTWLGSLVMDLIRLKSGGSEDAIVNCDLQAILAEHSKSLELKHLFSCLDQLSEYARWSEGQLNEQLALEDIFISWGRLGRQYGRHHGRTIGV